MTPKQARFIAEYAVDGNGAGAAIRAGYAPGSAKVTACRLLTQANVREALAVSQQVTARRLELDKERVLDGLMQAIVLAKERCDPSAQIAGWREIAKLCGFYAPEIRRMTLSTEAKGARERMERMTDEELLALAGASP